jgi:hypothetical protein
MMGIVNTDPMSTPSLLFPKTGRWLASRKQHEEYHVEWEEVLCHLITMGNETKFVS